MSRRMVLISAAVGLGSYFTGTLVERQKHLKFFNLDVSIFPLATLFF